MKMAVAGLCRWTPIRPIALSKVKMRLTKALDKGITI
jgi:hypothetical protein